MNTDSRTGHEGGPAVRNPLSRKVTRRPALLATFAFIFGLGAGMLILLIIKPAPAPAFPNIRMLGGTMHSDESSQNWHTNGTLQLQGPQFRGTCQSRYSESQVEIYLNLTSDETIETILEFNPEDFGLEMVVTIEADAGTTINSGEGKIDIHSSGSNRLAIRLTNKNRLQHSILLQILQNGIQAYQNAIPVNEQD